MATGINPWKRRLAAPVVALLLASGVGLLGATPALANNSGPAAFTDGDERRTSTPAEKGKSDRYLVRLAEPPVAAYSGGVDALPATRPKAGERLAAQSDAARRYRDHLAATRSAVLSTMDARADQTYTTAFNGFSASLSPAQVAALRADQRVAAVTEQRTVEAHSTTPTSAWRQPSTSTWGQRPTGRAGSAVLRDTVGATTGRPGQAPVALAAPGTGAGVVIGVIDSGIWPESASFARTMSAPPGWQGTCQTGNQFPASACNGKILGARHFATDYLARYGTLPTNEVLSARDMLGHGSHTASTAAGVPVSNTVVDGRDLGPIAGVAPDAHIAVYKALWDGTGTDADIIAAIDAAVADGVQVINYSVGYTGGDFVPNDAIGNAFLNAYLAGVFVAASAGNDGKSGTISNTYPWVTTVGAAISNANEATIALGGGASIVGTSVDSLPSGSRSLVYAGQASTDGTTSCQPGSLDATKVQGKVVACNYSDKFAAVDEVRAKGGAAVILFGDVEVKRINNLYGFPTVTLWTRQQAGPLLTHLQRRPTTGTVTLSTGGNGSSLPGVPSVVNFSSWGPDQVHTGLQKPDLAARGTDVVAAVAPPGNNNRNFDVYSGTSMAAPHVAGMAAILKGLHANWSPGTIASALRTTATDTVGTSSPLKQGSGMPDPTRANDPGLAVVPSATELTAFRDAATPDGKELNLPSIALREYDGTNTVTVNRRFTNVGSTQETYQASVSGLTGMSVTMNPSSFTVSPGNSVTVAITVNRGSAPFDRYAAGAITWASPTHSVRMTVSTRPWGFNPRTDDDSDSLAQFGWHGSFGEKLFQPGFTGSVTTRTTGYRAVSWSSASLSTAYPSTFFDSQGDNIRSHSITVPTGSAGLVVQTTSTGAANLDLYVYRNGRLISHSLDYWSSNERSVLYLPEAGAYTAYVHAQRGATAGGTANYQFAATVLARNGSYTGATVQLTDAGGTPTTSFTRGNYYTVRLTPTGTLPNVEHWAYTEFTTGGKVVSGPLISSR
ncbi:S8 family serine peptidase [Micromonospora sp. WMMD1102]|uniref:S8 family serine peptidase n=1 Tax=Micromonospora sp. WMMD1102 TaxID=3016105 RepID=UPI002414E588|nr:S8 family serine peptidase [Micromonospora sp. WMMD1102]MDG4788018.1 S8 family serine peptidase [Micromonospora sp. WMMD1102]